MWLLLQVTRVCHPDINWIELALLVDLGPVVSIYVVFLVVFVHVDVDLLDAFRVSEFYFIEDVQSICELIVFELGYQLLKVHLFDILLVFRQLSLYILHQLLLPEHPVTS